MNYRALSIDELAAHCARGDAGARVYAGMHFSELIEELTDVLQQRDAAEYEEAVNQAACALADKAFDEFAEELLEHKRLPASSPYWRIG